MGVVGAVVMAMAGLNFGLFVRPISEELGIGKSFFGWTQTARLVGFALSGFVVGRIVDRYGSRWPLVVAGIAMGVAVFLLSMLSEAWHLVGLFLMMGIVGMQGGSSNLYTSVPIARWFVRKRGKAMSFAFLGGIAGIAISAPLSQLLIDHLGWRDTWRVLGISGAIIIVVVALLFVRRQPQDMGLLPDGARPDQEPVHAVAPGGSGRPTNEYSFTRAQAVRTPAFWSLAVVFGMLMFGASTMGIFRIDFFAERGVAPQVAAFSVSLEALASAAVALSLGMVIDRLDHRYVGAFGFCTLIGSFLVTMATNTVWHAFTANILAGFGMATMMILQNTLWPRFFGSRHLGSIRGVAMPVTIAFSAIGAPLTGFIRDTTGSYIPAWWMGVGGMIFGVLLLTFTRRPRPPIEGEQFVAEGSTTLPSAP
jgi:MFS family permease